MTLLSARSLDVRFGDRGVLDVPAVDFASRGLVGLIGANGAGKTTLLRALAGLITMRGVVRYRGQRLDQMTSRSRARHLAYLPQNATAHWPLSVKQLVGLGRLPHRSMATTINARDRSAVNWAMGIVDVTHLAERAVTALSGGERARVMLARCLAVRAPVLLVDEPTASLDPYHQLLIMQVLADYARDAGLVISVLHDLTLAARFCERLVLVHGGKIVADGSPGTVLSDAELARCYQIRVLRSEHEGPVIVPIARVETGELTR